MSRLCITIQLATQTLDLSEDEHVLRTYLVSTAKNGVGEQVNSYCTPRGHHIIRAKIGAGCPLCTVFVGRRPTGEIWRQNSPVHILVGTGFLAVSSGCVAVNLGRTAGVPWTRCSAISIFMGLPMMYRWEARPLGGVSVCGMTR